MDKLGEYADGSSSSSSRNELQQRDVAPLPTIGLSVAKSSAPEIQNEPVSAIETTKTELGKQKKRPIVMQHDIPDHVFETALYAKHADANRTYHQQNKRWRDNPAKQLVAPATKKGKTKTDPKAKPANEAIEPTSVFHGASKVDYQGRSFIVPPKGIKSLREKEVVSSYTPKKCIYVFRGHQKGVGAIRWFPNYGHLLLSGSMDSTIKIWSTMQTKQCLQTYQGHSKAVKDISFNNEGNQFLSSGFDGLVRVWDTENGKCLQTMNLGSITPLVVRFNPDPDKQNQFLVGRSDKKITEYDMRSEIPTDAVQTYDSHLAAVNSIAFVDHNRKFVSSSDDKTLCIWEVGVPVVIKYVSDPQMFSMPMCCTHPSLNYISYQSMKNEIWTYSLKEREFFKSMKNKIFTGHLVAGYACGLSISPDGRFIASGDSQGRAFFWDWKSARIVNAIQAHNNVCVGVEWHPTIESQVATCGWDDGEIKLWG